MAHNIYYLLSIIYYLLSIIYYLCSKKNGANAPFFYMLSS